MNRPNTPGGGQRSHPTLAMLRASLTKVLPAVDDGAFDDLLRKIDSRYSGSTMARPH